MTSETSVRELQKGYGSKTMALAIGIGMVFLLFGYKDICRGLVLGALFSTVNFVLMAQTLHKRITGERKRASLIALGNLLLRYAFLAIPLILAVRLPRFDLAATIAGLFMVQPIILYDHILRNRLSSWRK